VLDDAAQIAATAPWSFLIGAVVGFLLANRFRLIKRNGDGDEHDGHGP
jgi:hypothetical protein